MPFPKRRVSRGLTRLGRAAPLWLGGLMVLFSLVGGRAQTVTPTTEFDIPFQIRVLSDGAVIEVSGSFSWALPQNLEAVLSSAPNARVVRLESPGGHLLPAMQIATIIQQRGLDTYVGRLCASACTIAFLGGRRRWLAPDARLGFHDAIAPGFPADQATALLRSIYEKFAVPAPFIARVIRTPHTTVWYPDQDQLRAVHFTTGAPPASLLAMEPSPLPRLNDITASLRESSDDAVVQFAATLSGLVQRLQAVSPELCWAFTHEGPDDPRNAMPDAMRDAVVEAGLRLAQAKAEKVQAPTPEQRARAAAELVTEARAKGKAALLEGLRTGAEHAAFCPSLHELLDEAMLLPEPRRIITLRALLSGG